jgi:hypothetical protein
MHAFYALTLPAFFKDSFAADIPPLVRKQPYSRSGGSCQLCGFFDRSALKKTAEKCAVKTISAPVVSCTTAG